MARLDAARWLLEAIDLAAVFAYELGLSSLTVALSSVATGLSLTLFTVTDTVAVALPPLPSEIV